MHFISYDYRYNNDEAGIEPHTCQSYVFSIKDKAVIAMGRYLFKYACASIVHNDRKTETDAFLAVAGR